MVVDDGLAISIGSAAILAIVGGILKANSFASKVDEFHSTFLARQDKVELRLDRHEEMISQLKITAEGTKTRLDSLAETAVRIENVMTRLAEREHK